MKPLIVAAALLVMIPMVIGAATPHSDKEIKLVDDNGVVRLELSLGQGGTPQITMRDGKGASRINLSIDKTGKSRVALVDQGGSTRFEITQGPAGLPPGVIFYGDRGVLRTELRGGFCAFHDNVEDTQVLVGAGGVSMFADEKPRAELQFDGEERAVQLTVRDVRDWSRVRMQIPGASRRR